MIKTKSFSVTPACPETQNTAWTPAIKLIKKYKSLLDFETAAKKPVVQEKELLSLDLRETH